MPRIGIRFAKLGSNAPSCPPMQEPQGDGDGPVGGGGGPHDQDKVITESGLEKKSGRE